MSNNPYFDEHPEIIAQLLAFKEKKFRGTSPSQKEIEECANQMNLRSQVLSYYWSENYTPSDKTEIESHKNKILSGIVKFNPRYEKILFPYKKEPATHEPHADAMKKSTDHFSSPKKPTLEESILDKEVVDPFREEPVDSRIEEPINDSLVYAKNLAESTKYSESSMFCLRRLVVGENLNHIPEQMKTAGLTKYSTSVIKSKLKKMYEIEKTSDPVLLYEKLEKK